MKYRDSEGNLQEIYLPPTGDTLPIGFIGAYSGTTAPTNWLICDGSAVSRTTYSELFDVIGTTYGEGDGNTTFNLPNLKGKVITGLDSEDTDFDTLGENGGEKTHKLTVAEMPKHNHTVSYLKQSAGNDFQFAAGVGSWQTTGKENNNINYTGGDQAHNNLQPYIVQNYIIKAKNSVGLVGNVTNEYSESKQDSYSCDYINTKELWVNSDTTKAFESQQITLSSNDYDYIDIYFIAHVTRSRALRSARYLKGYDCLVSCVEGSNPYDRTFTRNSDTSYTISAGSVYNSYGVTDVGSTSNNVIIPVKIIGGHL